MKLNVYLENHSYPIYIERNAIQKYMNIFLYHDPNVLSTLSLRQQHNGLCEALKMGLILDDHLVSFI